MAAHNQRQAQKKEALEKVRSLCLYNASISDTQKRALQGQGHLRFKNEDSREQLNRAAATYNQELV